MCLNLYFAFRCLFCETPPIYLSEHILGEMSEWYWQRRGELGGECTYCSVCTHPAHSILGNCSASKKNLSLFCHSVSQVTFTANNLTGGLKKKKKSQKTGSIFLPFQTKTQLEDFKCGHGKRKKNTFLETSKWLYFDFNGGIFKTLKYIKLVWVENQMWGLILSTRSSEG